MIKMRVKKPLFEKAKKLEGMQTIESIMKILDISKRTAINYVSNLKKQGYIEYFSAGRKRRIYKISPIKTRFKGNLGLYETINKHSKIKINSPYKHIIHDKKLKPEKALVLALKTQDFRIILASLNLFRFVKDWKFLNKEAKKEKLQRQIGALYDLAKKFIKVRKIDRRIERSMLNAKGKKYIYEKVKTKEFFDIAKKWRVEIPFQTQDLMRLKIG